MLGPLGWGEFRKLKTGTDYNSSLLGAGTTGAVERLLSLPVVVNNEMTANSGLIIDRTAIVSALGPANVATHESTYFTSDLIAVRGPWRVGHVVVLPSRCGKFTIGGGKLIAVSCHRNCGTQRLVCLPHAWTRSP
ncbi:hypothetical protein [Mycolicibacterium aichiense]|uniref:hypothetical protein n=1 Tax=Mycolicibacterium aichiense TaxID=1799 RepID=UPI000DFE7579|nr:hypothetical protein [Mycolicibacterium aichiense]MCV7016636.1 hypothetical protein [Mycolicibacterium aichiense]SUA14150.1 Uncharacterised protein [Mycolicibacterium aichiense]